MSNPINFYPQPSAYIPQAQPIYTKEAQATSFNQASQAAYEKAGELGQTIERFKGFLNDLNTPELSSSFFIGAFKKIVSPEIYKTICIQVSLAIKNSADERYGERILSENFFEILRLRDSNGKNPLDKILDQYISQAETYRSIGAINGFTFYLILLQGAEEQLRTQSLSSNPNLFLRANTLKKQASDWFNGLNPNAKEMLCKEVWKLDGEPPEFNYGYRIASNDIKVLLDHKGKCIVGDCLSRLETNKEPVFTFTTHFVDSEWVRPSDSVETVKNVQRYNYLRDLKVMLQDPNRSGDSIGSKYAAASPKLKENLKEVRELLCKVIAVCSYKSQADVNFGEDVLNKDPQWLAKSKNTNGVSVIDQMVSHYAAKIQFSRMEKEISELARTESHYPQRTLDVFNSMSDKVKEDLRCRVWHHHGGKSDPHFGGWGYGTRTIDANAHCLFHKVSHNGPSILKEYQLELQDKCKNANAKLLAGLERVKAIPQQPVDVSTKPLEQEPGLINALPENLRVAVVTAEFEPAGLGGLKPAVSGMVRAFGANDTRVIMPLYTNGPISEDLIKQMKETDHQILVDGHRVRVMKAKINGVRCYFIDHSVFWIPKKADGVSSGNFYEGDYDHIRYRWAVFQKAAADLCYNFSKKRNPVQLVHCHDSQTALVPKFLKEHHPQEWAQGKTPVVHFTYHNNAEPMAYESDSSTHTLERMGLPRKPLNSFIEALEIADVKSTVSEQFGKESQMPQADFGNGLHDFVKKAALEKNLFGVVNGNTISFDPRKDTQLQNWTSVLPGTKDTKVDLRFGPNSTAEELAQKTVQTQRELCAYLKSLDPNDPAYADLDPEKPIFMYLGRYDTRQKGINKLRLIMEEVINSGAQFVCVGLEPDDEAKHILWEMKEYAKARGNKGVLILEDSKVGKDLKYQGVFGMLLRSIAFPVFPSRYEPCGLVQGEFNCYGRIPLATATGGFVDTLQTEGPNRNGYLFKRLDNWDSQEQDEEIKTTLRQALGESFAIQNALYSGDMEAARPHMERAKQIMKNALNSTWEKTPDGSLSAVRKRCLIDAKGFQNLKLRGGAKNVDLEILSC